MSEPNTELPQEEPKEPIKETVKLSPEEIKERERKRMELKTNILKALQRGKRPRSIRRQLGITYQTYQFIMR